MWLQISAIYLLLSSLFYSALSFHRHFAVPPTIFSPKTATSSDDIFGAEFSSASSRKELDIGFKSTGDNILPPSEQKRLAEESDLQAKIIKSKASFDKLRSTVLGDSIFISIIGLSLVWTFGTFKDTYSFGLGALLGVLYSVLLGNYIERIGTNQESPLRDGLRFAPIVILIAFYAKYKLLLNILMELLGYLSSYQLASLLQAFNENAYGELDEIDTS